MFEETNRVIGSHTSKVVKKTDLQNILRVETRISVVFIICSQKPLRRFMCLIHAAYIRCFSWSWLYGSLIGNYLCNHYLSPLMMWVRCGVRVTRSLVLCVCFIDRCLFFCTFSFDHCVVFSSLIYEFWLPLWYLQSLLILSRPPVFSVVRETGALVLYVCFVDYCLSFCTFSFGHYVVFSSSIYEFWLPLYYLQSLLRIRVLLMF